MATTSLASLVARVQRANMRAEKKLDRRIEGERERVRSENAQRLEAVLAPNEGEIAGWDQVIAESRRQLIGHQLALGVAETIQNARRKLFQGRPVDPKLSLDTDRFGRISVAELAAGMTSDEAKAFVLALVEPYVTDGFIPAVTVTRHRQDTSGFFFRLTFPFPD